VRQGGKLYFEVFEGDRLKGAASLKIRESDVRNHLSFCRGRLRHLLRARIRSHVVSEEQVEGEQDEALRGS
jgi:hypothetical protein